MASAGRAHRTRAERPSYNEGVKARSIIVYSVLRLLAFLVPLGLMMLIPIFHELYWFAIGFSAIIGISLSMLFLGGPREQVAEGLASRKRRRRAPKVTVEDQDATVEDAANDMVRGVPVDDEAAAQMAAAQREDDPTPRPAADAS